MNKPSSSSERHGQLSSSPPPIYDDPDVITKASPGLGEGTVGTNINEIPRRTAWPNAAGR